MGILRSPSAGASVDLDLGPALEFMRILWAVNHGLESRSRRMKRFAGVTGRERVAIRLIGRRPGMSAGQLAQILHVHPSTLTGLLDRVVNRGFVLRTVHPDDARRAVLTLTRKGRTIDGMRSGTIEARVRAALGRVAARDARVAAKVLGEIARTLAPWESERASAGPGRRRARTPQMADRDRRDDRS